MNIFKLKTLQQGVKLLSLLVLLCVFPSNSFGQFSEDFNNTTFAFQFGGFTQTPSSTSLNLHDPVNGWGGAFTNYPQAMDFTSILDQYLTIEYSVGNLHGTDLFIIEFYDVNDVSVRYVVPTSLVPAGVPQSYTMPNPIGEPTGGVGDFANFDFSQVRSFGINGQYLSEELFDINLENIVAGAGSTEAYGGQSVDAVWRVEAENRIDQNRKADLAINVVNENGEPVEGAIVRVRQQQHAFRFGTAVSINHILGTDMDAQFYRERFLDLGFNSATIENGLKWQALAGEFGPSFTLESVLDTLDWLEAHGVQTRGHALVWPGVENLPDFIEVLIDQVNSGVSGAFNVLRNEVFDHVNNIATATAGRVYDWDVVNEAITNDDLIDIFGESEMDLWFAMTRSSDANASLFINDFNIVNDDQRSKRVDYLDIVQGLLNRNAEVEGIGMQGHFSPGGLTDIAGGSDPQKVWDIYDQFYDATGLTISVTEYDLNTTDENLKADYLRDFMTATFAHQAIDGFTLWGFWEGRHWRPDAAMINLDWSETEMAAVWRQLVTSDWWTDEDLITPADGTATTRVFKGNYVVEVEFEGEIYTVEPEIGSDGFTFDVIVASGLIKGDVNGDGVVNLLDVGPFLEAMSGGEYVAEADINCDGSVNLLDVAPFVAILSQ